jgi:hypothetical protein
MSLINPGNNLQFKSTDAIFGRIRKRLKSFDAAGVIDEGDFYWYIKEVMERLGVAVYDELQAVVLVKDFKAPLPENFSYLYAAYKCTPDLLDTGSKQTLFPQTGFVFYIDEIHQPYRKCKNCASAKIDYVHGEKITVRTYLEGQPAILKFHNPVLLQLSGNARGICDDKCANLFCKSPHEITIDKCNIYTNFDNDSIYMKYYGLPLDPESGLPMIPDTTFVEKCIEDYIIYRILEDSWFNGDVPDMEKKYQVARLNSDDSFKTALYYCKLPSFQSVINKIRVDRKNLRIYQQTDF